MGPGAARPQRRRKPWAEAQGQGGRSRWALVAAHATRAYLEQLAALGRREDEAFRAAAGHGMVRVWGWGCAIHCSWVLPGLWCVVSGMGRLWTLLLLLLCAEGRLKQHQMGANRIRELPTAAPGWGWGNNLNNTWLAAAPHILKHCRHMQLPFSPLGRSIANNIRTAKEPTATHHHTTCHTHTHPRMHARQCTHTHARMRTRTHAPSHQHDANNHACMCNPA